MSLIGGIDLSALEKNYSGVCVIEGKNTYVNKLRRTEEIIEKVKNCDIIAIDAPLFLPKNYKKITKGMPQRKCDIELKKLKIKYFPLAMKYMKILTYRGIEIKNKLEKLGIKVIETYPGAVYDISGLDRKDSKEIIKKLSNYLNIENRKFSKDEVDAITCAYVAMSFYNGKYIALGNSSEGLMIISQI
ncbi:MAG: DUF429 domain-containing protein [Candidatus Parvarchaeota archaeon]|nr:DUF429 domain-containing protein [Candidatus Rehaiarchaeum fermentans]